MVDTRSRFDAYVFVDWSSRTGRGPVRPHEDSVWIGSARRGRPAVARYCRTRAEGTEVVRAFLLETLRRGERALAGFDFPYGYPAGLAAAARWGSPPWSATWSAIAAAVADGDDNRSNRFVAAEAFNRCVGGGPGPFWGRPVPRRAGSGAAPAARQRALAPTSPGFPFSLRRGRKLDRLRLCDRRLRGTQECWKLLGVGSVGSQALTGIPRVRSLRLDPALARSSAVWPFETGFTRRLAARIVHAEIWPGVVNERVARRAEAIRDEAQVLAMCAWARDLDGRGALGPLFERPRDIDDAQLRRIVAEEGWVLGCR